MIVIADASRLITLDNIDETGLLPKLYDHIYVTPEVAAEVGDSLPNWIEQRWSTNRDLVAELTKELEIGEASSIALALETPNCLLVIDEKKGRRTARKLGIEIIGTFGIILNAFESGLIEKPDTIVERLEQPGFRFSETLKAGMRERFH